MILRESCVKTIPPHKALLASPIVTLPSTRTLTTMSGSQGQLFVECGLFCESCCVSEDTMSDFISDDEWEEILSAGSALERADKVVRIAVRSVGALIFLGIGLSVIGLVWFAHHAADDSFQQMLAVSLASGLALYLAVAGVLAFGHKYRWMLRILLLVFAAVCGYFSY